MNKDDLDEYGFNKNYSYDTNVDHFEFDQHDNDGMFIDENGSVRYGKPDKKSKRIKKKKESNSNNKPSSKNKVIALITTIVILLIVKAVVPVVKEVIEYISFNNYDYSYNNNTEDIYNYYDDYMEDFYTDDDYIDYNYDKGFISVAGDFQDDIADEVSKVINFDSFNNFTLTYNNPENFDDYYFGKYNEIIQYCKNNKIEFSTSDDPSSCYLDIYDTENIDYLNIEYYKDEDYDYSYFEIFLVLDLENSNYADAIDTAFADFTSSLGDNSQQICTAFKNLSGYCYTNADYLEDSEFYGSIYDDNFSIYYDFSDGMLSFSVTIENPNYYDSSF